MRAGQAKRLLKNLIIADSALEIVEDTPETSCDAIYDLMGQKVLKYVTSIYHPMNCIISSAGSMIAC